MHGMPHFPRRTHPGGGPKFSYCVGRRLLYEPALPVSRVIQPWLACSAVDSCNRSVVNVVQRRVLARSSTARASMASCFLRCERVMGAVAVSRTASIQEGRWPGGRRCRNSERQAHQSAPSSHLK